MTIDAAQDARFMSVALGLGRRGLGTTWPNPCVGAVVVRDGGTVPVIVGRGWTQPGGRPHAETEALRRAGARARGATLYVTLEPCSHYGKTPPCTNTIIAAGIARVVSALEDPNPKVAGKGHAQLVANGTTVDVGIGAAEARRVHAGHIRRKRDGRPHVILKLAVSADGKAGLADRRPAAITGQAARDRVHLMRAQSDAILIGIGTALADDPLLTCRLPGMERRSPVRIVLDSNLNLPITSRLARTAHSTPLWVTCASSASLTAERALRREGAEVFRIDTVAGRLDLLKLATFLAEHGITRLMVEGGPAVAAAFVAADLVDEAVLFRSPAAIGREGIDALYGMPLTALTHSPRLIAREVSEFGADVMESFERA
jgi:diaminohydroxyphosphoribosylaminopyrimidine deaminase / 5-amino-6-(5-phosphoribosylamino)uracil reductase